jgi:hypothetical protein
MDYYAYQVTQRPLVLLHLPVTQEVGAPPTPLFGQPGGVGTTAPTPPQVVPLQLAKPLLQEPVPVQAPPSGVPTDALAIGAITV